MAGPIKLMGALDLGIELGIFLDTPPKVNAPMRLGMVFVNTNNFLRITLGAKSHHVNDPISYQHFMVLAPMH